MGCVQFSWRPGQASTEPAEAFVVTSTGRLLNGTLGGRLASDREGHSTTVSCAAWSPDGSLLAFASGSRVIVAAADGRGLFRATAKLPVPSCSASYLWLVSGDACWNLWVKRPASTTHCCDMQEAEEDGLSVVISTMAWAGVDALVLACSLYSNDTDDLEVQFFSLVLLFTHPILPANKLGSATNSIAGSSPWVQGGIVCRRPAPCACCTGQGGSREAGKTPQGRSLWLCRR